MTVGIVSWGVYLPAWRLQRAAISAALGVPAGRGTRSVAAFDEDTTTMAVEAARLALRAAGDAMLPNDLYLSTPAPPYLDKTNAAIVHDVVDLPPGGAYDAGGSPRSAIGAMRSALGVAALDGRTVLSVASDLRSGPAGSLDEREAGDGAVALLMGGGDGVVAKLIATASTTAEFLDRWRSPGSADSSTWEERFGEEVYGPLVADAWGAALKAADMTPSDIDHIAVSGLHLRAVRAATSQIGARPDALIADHSATVGNLGAAQSAFQLVDMLERARPGETLAIVSLADGADVVVFEVTDAIGAAHERRNTAGLSSVADLTRAGRDDLPYARFLTWRGRLRREPPRRPDPERPGAPATWRSTAWRSGFAASRCRACGFRHLPPTRVCLKCHSVDQMDIERLADVRGTVATFTVDHLAASPSPPVVGIVVDFDGGGRYRCQMTDVDPDSVEIGMPVEMTFRRIDTALGVHNYFWKARPAGRM